MFESRLITEQIRNKFNKDIEHIKKKCIKSGNSKLVPALGNF